MMKNKGFHFHDLNVDLFVPSIMYDNMKASSKWTETSANTNWDIMVIPQAEMYPKETVDLNAEFRNWPIGMT